jgi:hypothetical protein
MECAITSFSSQPLCPDLMALPQLPYPGRWPKTSLEGTFALLLMILWTCLCPSITHCLIVHPHTACDHDTLLLSQQFQKRLLISPCLQISHREVVAQQGGAYFLPAHSNPFSESTKQESNRTFGQRVSGLCEKEWF